MKKESEIRIRRPTEGDWPRMQAILETANYHRIGGSEMAEFPLCDCFVAEVNGVLAGVAGYRLLDAENAKTTLMAVDPAFRGSGIGMHLQQARMDYLRTQSVRYLHTNCDDEAVVDWYVRHFNYRPTGRRIPKTEPFGLPEKNEWINLTCEL